MAVIAEKDVMTNKFYGSWELEDVEMPRQFIEFAKAYLSASKTLCQKIIDNPDSARYVDSCVVSYMTYHAVELFLKGMILHRDPKTQLHHNVESLAEQYSRIYPENTYGWNVPFTELKQEDDSDPNQKLQELKKELPQEQIYRYPANRNKEMWYGAFAFEPVAYLNRVIELLESDFQRLETELLDANRT